ncbi:MAG TPA: small ribosomal subunit Rsm22 family protein, partial [Opitutaceae bacterium]|nr:small ribosomal subunit Rsm22 family protein [Opitutaceae bacterium]
AAGAARQAFPCLAVEPWREGEAFSGLLVISHVLNELSAGARTGLLALVRRAAAVLWVEPGTHADSRALQQLREELRGEFRIVAPCTHEAACGLLAAGRERDWCHHFATPPPKIFSDGGWMKFGRRAGIDLRSAPYSFLVLDRRAAAAPPAGLSRIIGRPEHFKAFARFLNCDAGGVAELTLQKRADPALFKQLDRERGPLVYCWRREGSRALNGKHLECATANAEP